MRRRQKSLTQGRWRAIALSVLLHSGIVAAAVYGWFTWKHRPPPVTTLAIEATVVDERASRASRRAPKPEPQPPNPNPSPSPSRRPPRSRGRPSPIRPSSSASRKKSASPRRSWSRRSRSSSRLEAEEERSRAARSEKQAAAKAAAEKAAAERPPPTRRRWKRRRPRRPPRPRRQRTKRRASRAKRNCGAGSRPKNAAMPCATATRPSLACADRRASITARLDPAALGTARHRVYRAGQPGPGWRGDRRCASTAAVSMTPRCDESVETAVYRASPLPAPPNPALFERNLRLIFAPQ